MLEGMAKTVLVIVPVVVLAVLGATEVAPRLLARYTAQPDPTLAHVHRIRTLHCDPTGSCWSATVPPLYLDVCVDCFTPPRDPHLTQPFARHRMLP